MTKTPNSVVFDYFDNWREENLTCLKCAWQGKINVGDTEEFRELTEFRCPKCAEILAIINHPTLEEIRQNWDRLSPEEKRVYAKRMELDEEFGKTHLKSPAQLPEIAASPVILVWDIEFDSRGEMEGPTYTTIKHEGKVIWREPAYYECVARFNEVVKILRLKYGDRLQALIPTEASKTYLYGDILSASSKAVDISTCASDSASTTTALAQAGDQGAINSLRYQQEFAAHHLQRADQLPEVSGDFLVLSWDLAEKPPRVKAQICRESLQYEWDKDRGDAFLYVTLQHEGRELWSEAADPDSSWREDGKLRWKPAERYGELATIVKNKYGARLKDLVPSLRSTAYGSGPGVDALEHVKDLSFPKPKTAKLKLWRNAVAGYPDAQIRVGDLLREGMGVPKDWIRAAYWYRQAADQDVAYAQANLGLLYEHGDGVPQDDVEALKWFRKAAARGDTYARYCLGIRYRNGQGVQQDYSEAVQWLRMAADRGLPDAQFELGTMYSKGEGVPQDYVEAHKWFTVAVAGLPGLANKEDRNKAIKDRDTVAAKMTRPQIVEARRLARDWKSESRAAANARCTIFFSSSSSSSS